jgi:hypothetical protein
MGNDAGRNLKNKEKYTDKDMNLEIVCGHSKYGTMLFFLVFKILIDGTSTGEVVLTRGFSPAHDTKVVAF